MQYLTSLPTRAREWFGLYISTFEQVVSEAKVLAKKVDHFMDDILETEKTRNFVIALIIATPLIGAWLFFYVLI